MTEPKLVIRKPDDMHAHLRDGPMLERVLPYTARHFRRAIVMPNLVPAVRTVNQARDYMARITRANALAAEHDFTPLMTLYLTEETTPELIAEAKASGFIHAFKNYPNGATTNSSEGVRNLLAATTQLAALEACNMPLLLHGEVTVDEYGRSIDQFDRERIFVEEVLPRLIDTYPKLRIVLEHITTEVAANFMDAHGGPTLATTITPHHLAVDRQALFEGGLNPHFYCLPILKKKGDLEALRALATTGYSFVFAGTDTAPHPTHAKERACGCAAGCFVAPVAVSMYAEVFEQEKALSKLESFLSEWGAEWYDLPLNEETITLVRKDEAWAPTELVDGHFSNLERRHLPRIDSETVRPFGMHTDPAKSLRWHWQVEA